MFGTQYGSESTTASRLDLTLLETPATVDIIDGDAIRARLDTNVLEAVTRSAGLTNESNPGNGNSSIQARGFDGQGSVTKLYDGTNYFTAASTITFPFDTWGVERIEVLKGPSSVLYGEGGIGGAINIIPRRPQRERSGDVRVIMGENRTSFFGFDHTGGLGDSTAYRIDYSKSDSDNWVRDGESEAEMLSLALTLRRFRRPRAVGALRHGRAEADALFRRSGRQRRLLRRVSSSRTSTSRTRRLRYEDDSHSPEGRLASVRQRRVAGRAVSPVDGAFLEEQRVLLLRRHEPSSSSAGTRSCSGTIWITPARVRTSCSRRRAALRASVGIEIERHLVRAPHELLRPRQSERHHLRHEFDTVDPFNFQPGVLADITDAPFLPDNMSDVSAARCVRRGTVQPDRPVRDRRSAAVGRLRHVLSSPWPGRASTSRSTRSRAASASWSRYRRRHGVLCAIRHGRDAPEQLHRHRRRQSTGKPT